MPDHLPQRKRVITTIACEDTQGIPKVNQAGQTYPSAPTPYQLMHNGIKVRLGEYHGEWMSTIIKQLRGHYKPQEEKVFYEVLKSIPDNGVMVEVGSYWAYFSMWFQKNINCATNYLIEPVPVRRLLGEKNFLLNNMNGTFIPAHIGGNKNIFVDWNNQKFRSSRISIDQLIKQFEIPFIHIVHCNIQGKEYEMLQGMEQSIKAKKVGYVFVSSHGERYNQCLKFFKNNNFHIIAEHTNLEGFAQDGLIVARAPYYPGINRVFVSKKGNPYCSQWGQDKFANETFFKNKRDGVFVDIGAFDGQVFSNSYFFEKNLGWKGICIEPNPESFNKLIKSRNCTCIHGAISNESGNANFYKITGYCEQLSGLEQYYHPKHLNRINKELNQFGGDKECISVKCYHLNDLLNAQKIKKVDFLSLDTEGSEYEILQSINFNDIVIDVITVENNYQDNRIRPFLEAKGYSLVKTIESDEIYKLKAVKPKTELPITIVIPSYNNEDVCIKNIESALTQNYSNYSIIYTDDCSTDKTHEKIKKYLENHPEYAHHVSLLQNQHNTGALANLYSMIHSCPDNNIIVTLDGDDQLAHPNVLRSLNETYQNENVWITYGQYEIPGWQQGTYGAEPIPQYYIDSHNFRQWPSIPTHLRTFYAGLFKKINIKDLLYHGKFFPMAWDSAFMFPMLEMAGSRFKFIKEVLYIYNVENPLSDRKKNRHLQSNLDSFIRSKKPYIELERLF